MDAEQLNTTHGEAMRPSRRRRTVAAAARAGLDPGASTTLAIAMLLSATLFIAIPVAAAAQSAPPASEVPTATVVPSVRATQSAPAGTELTFRLVDDPDLADLGRGSFVIDIIQGNGVLVALTMCPEMQERRSCRPSILRSVDGLDWEVVGQRLPFPGAVYGIAWAKAGFLFVIDELMKARQVVYRSHDGLDWDQMPVRGVDLP